MTTKSLAGLTVAIVVAVVAGIGAAWAGGDRGYDKAFGGRGHFGHFGGLGMGFDSGRMHRMLAHLDLSPEQEQQVKAIMKENHPRFESLGETMRSNHARLFNISPDDSAYSTVVTEVSQASADMAREMVLLSSDVRTAVFSILTGEQKAKAKEMKARMHDKMKLHLEQRLESLEGDQEESL